MKSRMAESGRHAAAGAAHVSAVELVSSATLPVVALIAIVPEASGVGSGVVPPVPGPSCTR